MLAMLAKLVIDNASKTRQMSLGGNACKQRCARKTVICRFL